MNTATETMALRTARPDDIGALQRLVASLSLRSRAQRFFAPLRELPRELVRALEAGDPAHRFVVAECGGDLVALGQYAVEAHEPCCELALVIADRWQGRGLGLRLLGRLLDDARGTGLVEARLETLPDNRAMQALAWRAGFSLQRHPNDPQLLLGRRRLAFST